MFSNLSLLWKCLYYDCIFEDFSHTWMFWGNKIAMFLLFQAQKMQLNSFKFSIYSSDKGSLFMNESTTQPLGVAANCIQCSLIKHLGPWCMSCILHLWEISGLQSPWVEASVEPCTGSHSWWESAMKKNTAYGRPLTFLKYPNNSKDNRNLKLW